MGNMSYCRFENTATDLADCEEALSEMIDSPEECGTLSSYEVDGARRLFNSAAAMLQMLIENAGGVVTVEINGEQQQLDQVDWDDLLDIVQDEVKAAQEESDDEGEEE